MTKEELKQEAEECMHNALFWLKLPISRENVEQGGSHILKLLEPREKRIAELEKENTELKEQNRNYEQLIDNGSVTLVKERLKNYKQLTKAKEHIKKLLDCLKQDTNDPQTNYYVVQYMTQAEQFLKDSEVEK